jgi:hypothetical protein
MRGAVGGDEGGFYPYNYPLTEPTPMNTGPNTTTPRSPKPQREIRRGLCSNAFQGPAPSTTIGQREGSGRHPVNERLLC